MEECWFSSLHGTVHHGDHVFSPNYIDNREIKEKLEPLRVNRIEVYGEEIYTRNSISSGGDEVLSDLGVENPPKYW